MVEAQVLVLIIKSGKKGMKRIIALLTLICAITAHVTLVGSAAAGTFGAVVANNALNNSGNPRPGSEINTGYLPQNPTNNQMNQTSNYINSINDLLTNGSGSDKGTGTTHLNDSRTGYNYSREP